MARVPQSGDLRHAPALLAQLPLSLTFRDFNGVEKIAALPRKLSMDSVPAGDDPLPFEIGYYHPSGDLVFYYDDVGYFTGIVRIGQFDGSARQPPRRAARGRCLLHLRGRTGDRSRAALETLNQELGIRRLLLEGGAVNGSLLQAGLVDELSLVLAPSVEGVVGEPAVFDIQEEPGALNTMGMALEHCQVLEDGLVWLRYRFSWNA